MKAQKSIVLKRNFKKLIPILLPIAKNQINQIKSLIMCKIQNTLKKVSNTPKIVVKPEIATKPKIDDKPEIDIKPKNVNKSCDELKNCVIKQLKKHFKKLSDAKKKWVFR